MYQTSEQTSEALPMLFESILKEYTCSNLFFARGPGSFMAIKISYIFLKTLSLSLHIPLRACDGFALNEGGPIKAMRNLYFMKEHGSIVTHRVDKEIEQTFALPKILDTTLFGHEIEPLYMLPAI